MRLGKYRKAMDAVAVEHRYQDRVVCCVGVAVIGRIVQESIARLHVGMDIEHRPPPQVGHAGPGGAQQGICHLARNPFEALLHDRELDAIDFDPCFMHVNPSSFCDLHRSGEDRTSTTKAPFALRAARAPGWTTIVVNLDSTMAGPNSGSSGSRRSRS